MNANTLTQAMNRFWGSRTSRERRLLSFGAILLCLYLLWATIWQPSWQTLSQAPQRTAQLTQQMAVLQQLHNQTQSLRTLATPTLQDRQATAAALAQNAGAQVVPTPQGLRVNIRAWPAETLASFLDDLHQTLHLSPSGGDLQQIQGEWSGWMLLSTGSQP